MNSVEFLREREHSCREYASTINPCADAGGTIKTSVLERADQFKTVADELEAWPRIADAIIALAQMNIAADDATITKILHRINAMTKG